jgi:hypothetical protein
MILHFYGFLQIKSINMKVLSLLFAATVLGSELQERTVGGHCTDPSNKNNIVFGICLNTKNCDHGAQTAKGWCPHDGNSVLCCFKDKCLAGHKSACMFTSDCAKFKGKIARSKLVRW